MGNKRGYKLHVATISAPQRWVQYAEMRLSVLILQLSTYLGMILVISVGYCLGGKKVSRFKVLNQFQGIAILSTYTILVGSDNSPTGFGNCANRVR